jgi:hypothetical protein
VLGEKSETTQTSGWCDADRLLGRDHVSASGVPRVPSPEGIAGGPIISMTRTRGRFPTDWRTWILARGGVWSGQGLPRKEVKYSAVGV